MSSMNSEICVGKQYSVLYLSCQKRLVGQLPFRDKRNVRQSSDQSEALKVTHFWGEVP